VKKYLFFLFAITNTTHLYCLADSLKPKKSFYCLWGYNRESYTRSTIHFVNKNATGENVNYDFVIKNARAHDKPDFHKLHDIKNFTIPQYSFRVGMWLNNKNDEGFEFNYDHTKYVVAEGQTVRFTGTINGMFVDKDSVLNRDYFHFEHTDGANFWMVNYMRRKNMIASKNNSVRLGFLFKPGIGVVIPRTEATIMGRPVNNRYKLAGVVAGLETALRLEIKKHYLVELGAKAGWADYINAFVGGRGNGKASHHFGFVEGILSIGYQF
jgi:hypothetical protein